MVRMQMNVSHMIVWRLLREQLNPHHLQRVHALSPQDFPPWITFCQWFLQHCSTNPNCPASVLFTRDGTQNFHNQHVWADTNPNATLQSSHQQRFSVNIWAGIVGDHLLGPHVLPNRLTGQNYGHFLRTTLPAFLDDIPVVLHRGLYFMHDGAPAHFSVCAHRNLNAHYRGHWTGRGGPIAWPPRSPDLNLLDFFLWGYLTLWPPCGSHMTHSWILVLAMCIIYVHGQYLWNLACGSPAITAKLKIYGHLFPLASGNSFFPLVVLALLSSWYLSL
jgi:hypothetical protein